MFSSSWDSKSKISFMKVLDTRVVAALRDACLPIVDVPVHIVMGMPMTVGMGMRVAITMGTKKHIIGIHTSYLSLFLHNHNLRPENFTL